MKSQLAFQNLLKKKFEEFQSKNPRFSQRAFSKKIAISQGALSEILQGERVVSLQLAERVVKLLCGDPAERNEVLKYFKKKKMKNRSALNEEEKKIGVSYITLSDEEFKSISHWMHYAILSLIRTKNFRSDSKWIAHRLGISVSETNTALKTLTDLGLITIGSDQKITRVDLRIKTTDDIKSETLQDFYRKSFDHAKTKLTEVPIEFRDFSSVTMPADPANLPEAKVIIRKFYDDMHALIAKSSAEEVYRLSVQLYPLTQISTSKVQS